MELEVVKGACDSAVLALVCAGRTSFVSGKS